MAQHIINYHPSPTFKRFHRDNSLVRGIMGPLGSGKSTGCCYELMKRIIAHPPSKKDKTSYSIALVVRNTYRELKDTTVRTWLNLFPERYFGRFIFSEMVHQIRLKGIKADVLFRALDRPQDEAKLLSMEVTFVFVNEAREIDYRLIQMLPRRLRYPPQANYPDYWRGIIMDTNPPDTDHWWFKLFEEQKPTGFKLFKQPSGIAKNAENLLNLPKGYYTTQMAGASAEWLKIYRDGEYGFVSSARPVYSEYQDQLHCQKITPLAKTAVIVGLDFGRTPAAIFTQRDSHGRWLVLAEITTWDLGIIEFGKLILATVEQEFAGYEIYYIGDPAGNQKSVIDSNTVYTSLAAGGINARPAFTNSPLLRKEVLRRKLAKRPVEFLIDPRCQVLRKGLIGGYCYKRMPVGGKELYFDKPVKNKYSHPVEALEYALLGADEDQKLVKMAQQTWRDQLRLPPRMKLDKL